MKSFYFGIVLVLLQSTPALAQKVAGEVKCPRAVGLLTSGQLLTSADLQCFRTRRAAFNAGYRLGTPQPGAVGSAVTPTPTISPLGTTTPVPTVVTAPTPAPTNTPLTCATQIPTRPPLPPQPKSLSETGIGESLIGPFIVGPTTSATVSYAYEGTGFFILEVRDAATGNYVSTLSSQVGPLDARTVVTRPGRFSIRVKGRTGERWAVTVGWTE